MSRGVHLNHEELASVLARLRRPSVSLVGDAGEAAPAPSRNKYGAVRTEYNGHWYASKSEASRARQLDLLLAAGEIRSWEPHPLVIILWPGTDDVLLRYRADFRVMGKDRSIWYEEVKGRRVRDWPLREHILRLSRLPLRVIQSGRAADAGGRRR